MLTCTRTIESGATLISADPSSFSAQSLADAVPISIRRFAARQHNVSAAACAHPLADSRVVARSVTQAPSIAGVFLFEAYNTHSRPIFTHEVAREEVRGVHRRGQAETNRGTLMVAVREWPEAGTATAAVR